MTDHPLLATSDLGLLEELLRLCAAAAVEAHVVPDPAGARAAWATAPLVVLGDDLAEAALAAGMPRRPDLLLLTRDPGSASAWERAAALAAEGVIVLPDAQAWLLERLTACRDGPVADGAVVSVVGGRGGAGASTLAAALAVTAARRCRTLLLDMDPLGGGLDLVLGAEHEPGLRWPDLAATPGRVSASALAGALPARDGLALLSWDRGDPCRVPADLAGSVLAAGRRGHDLVVVDLPRRLDPPAEVVASAGTVVVLVVPAEVRAAAAAARVAAAVGALAADLRLVVRGPAPSALTAADLGRSLGLPCVGWLRPEPGLAAALERGEAPAGTGRGPLAELCRRLLDGPLDGARRVA